MNDEKDDFDRLGDAWRNQAEETMEIAIDNIKSQARTFQRKSRNENLQWWAACAILAIWTTIGAITGDDLFQRIGAASLALGAVFICIYLFFKDRSEQLPDFTVDSTKYLETYKNQLYKRAKLLRTVSWSLFPLLPGIAITMIAMFLGVQAVGESPTVPAMILGVTSLLAIFIIRSSKRAARKLEAQAAAIETGEDFRLNKRS